MSKEYLKLYLIFTLSSFLKILKVKPKKSFVTYKGYGGTFNKLSKLILITDIK